MKKSNFTKLLAHLDEEEVYRFDKYLKRFHPAHEMTTKVFPFYKKYLKKQQTLPDVETAYRKLYKKKPSQKDMNWFNNRFSKFYRELKAFLIQQKLERNEFQKDYLWLEILKDKGMSHEKKLHFNKSLKREMQEKNGGLWQSLRLFQLHDFAIEDTDFLKNYQASEDLIVALNYLETFRLDVNLKYASELKNREKILQAKSADAYFKPFLTLFKENKDITGINTELYFKIYNFLKHEKESDFEELKNFLIENDELLYPGEQRATTFYLLNYVAAQIKAGRPEFNTKAFEIYSFALEKGFLIDSGVLPLWQFQNIINIACFLKKYTWANDFIKTYHLFLEKTIRTQFVNIAYATVLFSQKNFTAVVKLLDGIELKVHLMQMLARIYLLASYYELEWNIDLDVKSDSFIRFIRRSNLGKNNKLAAINFGQIFKKILARNVSKAALRIEEQEAKHLYFRHWLDEKITNYQPVV